MLAVRRILMALSSLPVKWGRAMINLDQTLTLARWALLSGHINPSRVNQYLFYVNPSSLNLKAAPTHFSFFQSLLTTQFLEFLQTSSSQWPLLLFTLGNSPALALKAPVHLSVSVVWPINNIDPWELQPAAQTAVGGIQHCSEADV